LWIVTGTIGIVLLIACANVEWRDLLDGRNVIMVSENMSRELWGQRAGGHRETHRLVARPR
jgi:hypothetical protein